MKPIWSVGLMTGTVLDGNIDAFFGSSRAQGVGGKEAVAAE